LRGIEPIGTNGALVGVAVMAVNQGASEVTTVPGGEVIIMDSEPEAVIVPEIVDAAVGVAELKAVVEFDTIEAATDADVLWAVLEEISCAFAAWSKRGRRQATGIENAIETILLH
jgi:hypothetical protein